MRPETQTALNAMLHDSTLEQISIDPDARSAACALSVVAKPLYSTPLNPCTLILHGLSRIRVALFDQVAGMPADRLPPIELAGLNKLIRHFNHPQAGFDFIDSNREDILAGQAVLDVQLSESSSPHSLTFFWGVGSTGGSKYLLLMRLWFEFADFLGADGRTVPWKTSALAETYAKAGVPFVVVPGSSSGVSPMPDVVPPVTVGGESLAILFVDPGRQVRARAIGKGVWDGTKLQWLGASGTLYEIPPASECEIRPALAEWRAPGDLMGGFSFWTTIPVTSEDAKRGGLVTKYLRPSSEKQPRAES